MRIFYFFISIYAIILLPGCSKSPQHDCYYQNTAGVVSAISGPDSIRINEQNELTLDVVVPGLCVADIKVDVVRVSDSVYYLDANVKYSTDKDCNCQVKDHHFVRLYFSSPVAGTMSLSATPGIGPSAGHMIKVY